MASNDVSSILTLKVGGLGHTLTLETLSSITIGDLKKEIEGKTGVPAAYQRLLARGKKLDTDELSLQDAGLEDRTRLMLLRNALYVQEKDIVDSLLLIRKEIEDLEEKKDTTPDTVRSELVTRICCKLDGVDTRGSGSLRALRKQLIRRAESIDESNPT